MSVKRHHNLANWIIILILLTVAGGLVGWWLVDRNNKNGSINSYDDCVTAGNVILETYPEQCRTNDGRSFTRDITDELNKYKYTSNRGVELIINSPIKNESLTSPFVVMGQVPGNWSFEGSFQIELLDKNGERLEAKTVQLIGEWTTEEFVLFDATLKYSGYSGDATVILHKDNPSGLTKNDDSVSIDVVLSQN